MGNVEGAEEGTDVGGVEGAEVGRVDGMVEGTDVGGVEGAEVGRVDGGAEGADVSYWQAVRSALGRCGSSQGRQEDCPSSGW